MGFEEAMDWLKGLNSTINYAYGTNPGDAQERAMRQDAAMTEQAYWIVRAHKEGLLGIDSEDT
jgi:poly-gamma-glutamate capsule biosynthesis protein CapA/YwtB (metallophosphatase superfamily)